MEKSTVYRAMASGLTNPDERSVGVYKMLMDVYPAFSKKLFERNELMNYLVMTGNNPMDILDYPICGKCETLALWHGTILKDGKYYDKCTCIAHGCGATTVNPITLRDWIKLELHKKAPPEYIEAIEFCVDRIAHQMLIKHRDELRELVRSKNGTEREKSIIMPDGSERVVIQHNSKPEDIDLTKEED